MEGAVKIAIENAGYEADTWEEITPPASWPAARVRRTSVFTAGENLGGGAALPP